MHFHNDGIGSFIASTCAIRALAEHFDAEIDVVLDRSWTDSRRGTVEAWCDSWSLVNRVMDFQQGFRKEDYVHLFYAKHDEECEAARYFAENAGYEALDVDWRIDKPNEVDHYMNEVYRLGYRGPVPDPFCIQGKGVESFDELVRRDGETFRIGFCDSERGWPHFRELARLLGRLLDPYKIRVYLLGDGKGWAEDVMEDNKGAEREIVSFVDHGIDEAVHMVRGMHLFVTADTGLMRVADAVGTPTVALFGPMLVSKNGPRNRGHRIVRSPLGCAPCQHGPSFGACEEWKCMRELKPWMVLKAVREYLYELYAEDKIRTPEFRGGLSAALSLGG